MKGRWLRLDTTWSSSGWLADLEPESRLCWVELLCYGKAHGIAGRVKTLHPTVAARQWGVTRNAVTRLLEAAHKDEALVTEGEEWIITGWPEYQMDATAPDRMKRYRQRKQEDTELSTIPPVTPVTRNPRSVTRTETVTETKTERKDCLTSSLPPVAGEGKRREDGGTKKLKRSTNPIQKWQALAKQNIAGIHGDTDKQVLIEGHRVGMGIEVKRYQRLAALPGQDPEMVARAIRYLPQVTHLHPPVSLARWEVEADGWAVYQQCLGLAYREVERLPPAVLVEPDDELSPRKSA